MNWNYLILILAATVAGGLIPMTIKRVSANFSIYLLAFTGAFLFGVVIMHLLPEVYHELGHQAGIYIVLGFFLQVFLQQLSHGMEHGHTHLPQEHHHHIAVTPLLLGLSIHAFMEGIPLGFKYDDQSALPSLIAGVAAHKIPEALTLMTVMIHAHKKRLELWSILVCFALVTPIAALLAGWMGNRFEVVQHYLLYVVALVVGAFLHISTTIFYESGTKHHELSWKKVLAIAIGLLLAFLTLIFE
ncbi:ZIP family metal transporter [Chitinophaga polysaccharea]|uniref:ZIP family metal transporter n=1 Tax=Chitinophaga TaxID=79328 RepID=UPI0014557CA3|nr:MULTISPECIES: ZIP family metal transporter [Chitinophaga]NLR61167.1 ZIP family metal transporter [Chitinophaga polysaccharea]NLU95005.1 ZIP family metal transporter [Chitinophaga sp. Ak27]